MQYLTGSIEIITKINELTSAKILWVDTEIADWYTEKPRLSIIQVLTKANDAASQSVYIFDVLDKHDLISYFINQIMINPQIEKVCHNASFDLKYLGSIDAQNITCTLKKARRISKEVLQVSNLQLKTLATELCNFSDVDKEEQGSDWGRRPLTQKQLKYAAMDTVYLAAVHQRLLAFSKANVLTPVIEVAPSSTQPVEKPKSLTPNKLRLAFECPRLLYLNHHFGGSTLFLQTEDVIDISQFHNLVDELINLLLNKPDFIELFRPSASELVVEQIAHNIQQLYYNRIFYAYLQKATSKDSKLAQPLLKVWEGLKKLIISFAELLIINRNYCDAENVISETFIVEDRKLEHYFNLPDNSQLRVLGRYDYLVFNFDLNRLCLIEFKAYQPVDLSAQLAQVAVYSYMLSQNKKAPVDSVVYCILPFKEYYYSWEQLEHIAHELIPRKLEQMQQWLTWRAPLPNPPPATIQPHLCQICPQQQKCQSYFGGSS
ncbi:hypothetical protein DSM106972_057240 [Dulcicalothrix desertica PCC 7102]|uniref:3'-5' exonuclease domain-containing protein n=1 Tax=Dulcicalothrix desertica PCC 7102 TaxID=232991 RepID=A0A3S1B155_9CYAN|nr:PD-(D/E)XK nuclease family protein [Dulcicalothrix desertica]RUT02804.1 hypothetical protein DSM106972_057240 [Dulcicalothrix desertica PCC 7102]TWH38962.1 S-DNA-T family DNA segregation ATPase FtsK/SpoIIIE [Dulcicalothrix desertica PCC 7102]